MLHDFRICDTYVALCWPLAGNANALHTVQKEKPQKDVYVVPLQRLPLVSHTLSFNVSGQPGLDTSTVRYFFQNLD